MIGTNRVLALSLACIPLASQAGAGSLDELMADLAGIEQRSARFVEERTLSVLDQPLITEGTFVYEAPDRLIRQDLFPDAALYALDGNRLDILIDGEERSFDLDREPMIETLIAPFRAVFAGDLETLQRSFDVGYQEDAEGWSLTLKPKLGTAADRFMKAMVISGAEGRIETIETEERDGDLSVLRLERMEQGG